MEYVLVQMVNGAIVPRMVSFNEAYCWYELQKDTDEPFLEDVVESAMFGSVEPGAFDMLFVVKPLGTGR